MYGQFNRDDTRALLPRARVAVQAVEKAPSQKSLRALEGVLCELPLDALDDASDRKVCAALSAVSQAADSVCLGRADGVEAAYHELMMDGPCDELHQNPVLVTVIDLTNACFERRQANPPGSMLHLPWDNAHREGICALKALFAGLHDPDGKWRHRLAHAVTPFTTAVRKAVVSRALCLTRQALVEVAAAIGLFPIEMRQPLAELPRGAREGWTRRIGPAVHRFEVTEPRPLDGAPHGLVVAVRIDPHTGERHESHARVLKPQPQM